MKAHPWQERAPLPALPRTRHPATPVGPDHHRAGDQILVGVRPLVARVKVEQKRGGMVAIRVTVMGSNWVAAAVATAMVAGLRLRFGRRLDVGTAGVARAGAGKARAWIPILSGGKRDAIEQALRAAGW